MVAKKRLTQIVAAGTLAALLATPAAAGAQTASGAGQQSSGGTTGAPVTNLDLDRVRLAINREPVLDLTNEQIRFYSLVTAKAFDVERVLGGDTYDLLYGPTRGGAAMTHTEFLKMVTPEELYSSAGIKASEMLQWSMVNIVGHAILRKLLTELKEARTERQAQEIRQQIERELEAIKRAGGGGAP